MEEQVDQEIRAGAADEVLGNYVRERRREAGGLDKLANPGDPGCPIDITGREIGSHEAEVLLSLEVEPTGVIDREHGHHVANAGDMQLPESVPKM